MKKSLLALAFGGFGIGLTEFVVMGLLPDIAGGFALAIPQAGYMISAYAFGVVVGAPLLTVFAMKLAPHRALLALMGIFTVFNGISGFAPNFEFLVVMRFLSGLPHGAFFGIGAVVASRIAEPGKAASAVAVMFAGLTLANVFGVPLATFVGHHFSWRWAFAMVAFVGVVTLIAIELWIPAMAKADSPSLRRDLKIFKRLNLWLAILLPSIGFGGFFAWISYIAPLLTVQAHFSPNSVPLLMIVAGVGMTIGNLWGGHLADRYSTLRTSICLLLLLSFVLCLNGILANSMYVLPVLTLITGAVAMSVCAPIQVLLMSNALEAEMLGASLGQAAFNIGNALGAALGGIPLTLGYSYASPQWVGAAMSLTGAGIGGVMYLREDRD